ncbi:unnamed protein product [Protopolystoma xenopodis]|uniref:Uncharacterized protein n=1 Tax=Protopolystoma xenopodis TaxID=117903 RepID=A0A448X1L0_9PLAT|nr:unnamed protein product [Protopolystoma xenopodis]
MNGDLRATNCFLPSIFPKHFHELFSCTHFYPFIQPGELIYLFLEETSELWVLDLAKHSLRPLAPLCSSNVLHSGGSSISGTGCAGWSSTTSSGPTTNAAAVGLGQINEHTHHHHPHYQYQHHVYSYPHLLSHHAVGDCCQRREVEARVHAGVQWVGDRLYVVGGFAELVGADRRPTNPRNDIHFYDPIMNKWWVIG